MAKVSDFEKVKQEVKQIISQIAEIPLENITDDARFAEDLGVDSMVALEITASLEKKYRIVIPEEEIPKIRAVNDVYTLLEEKLSGK